MLGSDQGGGTYFGELEEAFMHQVTSLRRTQQATTTFTAHHGDTKRKPISLSLSRHTLFLSLAGQGQKHTTFSLWLTKTKKTHNCFSLWLAKAKNTQLCEALLQ
jgi:hypothetical protein